MGTASARILVKDGVVSTAMTAYDSIKWNLGDLMWRNTSGTANQNWVGPKPVLVGRPMEASTAIPGVFPHVIKHSANIFYVFLADNSTAAATRRIVMYEYNKTTHSLAWRGFITLTYSVATVHTIRGFRMDRLTYSTGTVAVAATAVTGTGTTWLSANSGMSVGARIGFGSTDPSQIVTWYQITAIGSDTGITLGSSAGTIIAGTPYVIEEYRAITVNTNATATNGGVFIAKGLNPDIFLAAGTTINAATTTDNIRAVYWLADAATATNTTACGCAIDDAVSNTQRDIYVLNSTGAAIYKYNSRAILTGLSAGRAINAFTYATGNQAIVGTAGTLNNGRLATLSHGPGAGVKCLYFVTTTRVYRVPVANITAANVAWQTDAMYEVPAGSTATMAASAAMSSMEVMDSIDRLIIFAGAATTSYITKYNATSLEFDYNILVGTNQTHQSLANTNVTFHPAIKNATFTAWSEEGMTFLARTGTTAIDNQLYAIPFGAHWDFTSTSVGDIISPKLATPNASRYTSAVAVAKRMLGSDVLGFSTESFKTYVRTTGIDDNTGGWTLLDDFGDISALAGASHIQFRVRCRTIGGVGVMPQILGFLVTYEDENTDSHFQPSADLSDAATKRFAWRFATAFGSTVPNLRIQISDAISGAVLLNDTTSASTLGVWEKSVNDGSSWSAYNTTDKSNDITYIRYTPTSLAAGIKVSALLTQV